MSILFTEFKNRAKFCQDRGILLKQDVRWLQLNNHYFYQLLFTRVNLRLVHISCHDKKEHSRNRLAMHEASHVTPSDKHTRAQAIGALQTEQ